MINRVSRVGLAIAAASLLSPGAGKAAAQGGPHAVGFRSLSIADTSRSFGTSPARSVQVSVWYPAESTSRSPLGLDALANLHDAPGVPGLSEWARRMRADASLLTPLLASPTRSVLEAGPSTGRFPLIVYAASFRAPAFENLLLFERLVEAGFVVVSIPSVGGDTGGMTMDSHGAGEQLRDLELARSYATELPFVDTTRVGAIGFSLGAVPAAILAVHDAKARAVVSIDGAMNYTYELFGEAVRSASPRLSAAYLQLTQRPAPSIRVNDRFYDSVAVSGAYHLQWAGMDHYDLAWLPLVLKSARPRGYVPTAREIELNGVNDTPYEERRARYERLVEIIVTFLDAHVRGSASALESLSRITDPDDHDAGFSKRTRKP